MMLRARNEVQSLFHIVLAHAFNSRHPRVWERPEEVGQSQAKFNVGKVHSDAY